MPPPTSPASRSAKRVAWTLDPRVHEPARGLNLRNSRAATCTRVDPQSGPPWIPSQIGDETVALRKCFRPANDRPHLT